MKINNSTINYISKVNHNNLPKNNNNISFGSAQKTVEKAVVKIEEEVVEKKIDGVLKKVTKGNAKYAEGPLQKFLVHASNNGIVQKIAEMTRKSGNGIANLLFLDSVILSSFYMINTAKNKNIKKDQKTPLILNQGLVFAISSIGTFTLEKLVKSKFEPFNVALKELRLDKYKKEANDAAKKAFEAAKAGMKNLELDTLKTTAEETLKTETKKIDKTIKGIDTMKTLFIFGMIYRFIAPVLVTPLANKLSEKIQHDKDAKKMQPIKA